MHYIVLATVRNVLGQETEIAANQLGALSIKEFCFVDQAEAIKAAYAYAEEFRANPERCNHINAELVYVTKVKAYIANEKENGDIDYDNLEQIPYFVADNFAIKFDNRTYAKAYEKLTEYISEYFRLLGLDPGLVQIDGIASLETSICGNHLTHISSELRFTVYDLNMENPIKLTAKVEQSADSRFFPKFGPSFWDEISDYEE